MAKSDLREIGGTEVHNKAGADFVSHRLMTS